MGQKGSTAASVPKAPASSLEQLAADLGAGKYKNVIVVCGAGISTNAGVPDFRSPSAGLYFKLRKYNLPYPEAIFEGAYFDRDPKPFYSLVRELFPETLTPTPTHRFFRLLEKKGVLKRVFTQNIEGLEFAAGVTEDKVVEAHGTFHRVYCKKCRRAYSIHWLQRAIFAKEDCAYSSGGVPRCEAAGCGGVVRPDVVLFGEPLPRRFFSAAHHDFKECDLVLVFGTSLAVAPFNNIVGKAGNHVPRVFINKTKPGATGLIGWVMGMGRNVNFDGPNDLVELGDCDEKVRVICEAAGWTDDLEQVEVTPISLTSGEN